MLESFPREENEFLIALCSIFPVSGSFPRIIQALPGPNQGYRSPPKSPLIKLEVQSPIIWKIAKNQQK